MTEQNLKTDTPDASFTWASAVLFGADSQASAAPSVYAASTVRTALLALANTWTLDQTFSGRLLVADGTNALPAIGFSGAAMGFYRSSGQTVFAASSADIWWTAASSIVMRNNGFYAWSSGSVAGTGADTSLFRESAGFIGTASSLRVMNATAIPAGGTAAAGYKFSSTANFGVFFGSGAPSLAAAKGSLYLRSDGSTTNDRAYINTDASTTWTALTTAA